MSQISFYVPDGYGSRAILELARKLLQKESWSKVYSEEMESWLLVKLEALLLKQYKLDYPNAAENPKLMRKAVKELLKENIKREEVKLRNAKKK